MPPGKKKAAYECLANYHCLKWQVAEISRQNITLCFMCILLSTVYQLVYFLGNRSDTGLCGEPSQAEKASYLLLPLYQSAQQYLIQWLNVLPYHKKIEDHDVLAFPELASHIPKKKGKDVLKREGRMKTLLFKRTMSAIQVCNAILRTRLRTSLLSLLQVYAFLRKPPRRMPFGIVLKPLVHKHAKIFLRIKSVYSNSGKSKWFTTAEMKQI